MKLYRLNRYPHDDAGCGENWDEWFPSLRAAQKRRTQLIHQTRDDDHAFPMGAHYSVDRCEFAQLPPRQLLLAVLNDAGFLKTAVRVLPPFEPNRS
jgi:hypothetical protein